ncbi:MAG: efflux RND transporter periplasmic adaptor subunit [Mariniblastus sp.]
MTSESQQLGFDLNALDLVLDSFSRSASDPSTERNKFYSDINSKIIACTESQASAVLLKNKEGQVRVIHQVGWKELAASTNGELKTVIKRVFDSIDSKSKSNAHSLSDIRAFTAVCTPQNGLKFVYVLVRDKQDSELAGQVFSDLTLEIASQIEAFENLRAADQKPRSVLGLTHIAQLIQNLGKSSSLSEMSYHLVNDLAKITKADRVTYVSPAGKINAVSGVSRVSFRTSVARVLSKIARLSIASGGSFEWSDGEVNVDGDRKPRGLNQLIDELPSVSGFAIPVNSEERACGVLLIEHFTNEDTSDLERRELVNEAINFASPVVGRTVQVYSIPAIGSLDVLFNRFLVKPVRVLLTSALLLGGLVLAGYLLFGFERSFEIYGEGVLQTEKERHVFAQIEGEIDNLLVEEGSFVKEGQRLLAISSESLEKELISIEGEIAEAKQEMQNLKLADFQTSDEQTDETKTASDIERLKIRLETLNERLAFFEGKKSQLEILAPITGQVTTPKLRQRLTARPIDRGDLMMTLSDTNGEWEIKLEIPDNRIEFVKAAQAEAEKNNDGEPLNVVFRLASDSETTFTGQLSRIDYRSDRRSPDEQSYVLAYVTIDEKDLGDSLRLGTRVYAKIGCGKRNNFFLLTYEAKNKIREWMFQ